MLRIGIMESMQDLELRCIACIGNLSYSFGDTTELNTGIAYGRQALVMVKRLLNFKVDAISVCFVFFFCQIV